MTTQVLILSACLHTASAQIAMPPRTLSNVDCLANQQNPQKIIYGQNGHMFIASMDLIEGLPTKQYGDKIVAISHNLEGMGIKLVVVPVAHKGAIDYAQLDLKNPAQKAFKPLAIRNEIRNLNSYLQKNGVAVVNTLPALDVNAPAFWKSDWHWKPEAARAVAQAVARVVNALPAAQEIPQVDFVTTLTGQTGLIDDSAYLLRRMQQLCGTPMVSRDTTNLYTTSRVSEVGLLDDDLPQIILAGTSYSEAPWNFDGFLKENLKKDVENVSVVGGGPFAALTNFLISERFRENKPKIIIWEWDTSRFRFTPEDDSAWQQLLVSSRTSCESGVDLLTSTVIKLSSGVALAKPTTEFHDVRLTFSDKTINDFQVIPSSGATASPAIRIIRLNTPNVTPQFFMALPPSTSLKIVIPEWVKGFDPQGSVVVRQCLP